MSHTSPDPPSLPAQAILVPAKEDPESRLLESALRRETPRLLRFLARLSGGKSEAEDLLQDVIERALRYRDSFDARRSAGGWLRRIAFRVFVDRRTRRAREPEGIGDAIETVESRASGQTAEVEVREELERLLAPLSDSEREIVLRFHARGESLLEVAHAMRLPLGTVKSHLHRARRRMAPRATHATRELPSRPS